jgi:CIC family chloride channel protein
MDKPGKTEDGPCSLQVLAVLSLLVGAAAGLVGAVFRLSLERVDRLRDGLVTWAHGATVAGFLLVTASLLPGPGGHAGIWRRGIDC